ncbi:hypothetical protein TEU_02480 [Thermococcus eurythermalis]|uniref:Uncharacterized protein n=1 Tax=Thermococcus eurythermalis TaxID=1505907 RepID=A0A097QS54_9EURY|nr:hypothetical protein [Thermococcus eurythermalis]AIU69298.1 hypothetical protein TEU_02480 [Thermococcus eurythermalis]
MGRLKDTEEFTEIAYRIIELAQEGKELTVYNLSKELGKRQESVRRVLNELVRLKVLDDPIPVQNSQGRQKKPYKLLWDPEKAKAIIECWKEFYSLQQKLKFLKHLADSKENEPELSELSYKFCPYIVLIGIDWIEGLSGFLGKFDWKTFLDKAIPLYWAVFSLRHDKKLRMLNEGYAGGNFFIVAGKNSCIFFEEARWVEYVSRRKAKMEIENKLLEMFYGGNDFHCLSVHYGDSAGTLSNYIFGVRYFIGDSRLVIFDFSPNPFLKGTDDNEVMRAFELLLEYLQEKYPEVKSVQVRSVSRVMENFLASLGFEERKELYLYTKTEKLPGSSRFIIELSKNPPSVSEMEWVVRIFEKRL